MLQVTYARLARVGGKLLLHYKIKKFLVHNQKFVGDDETHLKRTAAWIARAQDATPDQGVSRGNDLLPSSKSNRDGWQPSYPETTGYIIPTMIDIAERLGDVGGLTLEQGDLRADGHDGGLHVAGEDGGFAGMHRGEEGLRWT